MKKIAVLVAAAACAFGLGSAAQAADGVTLYGSISTGVVLSGNSSLKAGTNNQEVLPKANKFSEESAWYGDSIWGLTGEESLGNGWKVGFTLENTYMSDDGTMDGDLFGSQAYLKVTNDVVTVALGNIGGLASAGGDFDMVGGFDPMEAAFGVGGMGAFASRDLTLTNSALLQVAPVDGLTLTAMGSFGFGDDGDSEAKWKNRDHYYALGALYDANNLSLGAVVEAITYSDKESANSKTTWTYTLGAAYDFGVVRPSFMYQHGQKAQGFYGDTLDIGAFDYDAFLLGASAPVGNGTFKAAAQYLTAKAKDAEFNGTKGKAFILGAAYVYDLSKRTSLYAGATYSWGDKALDKDGNSSNEFATDDGAFNQFRAAMNGYQVGFGINHTF